MWIAVAAAAVALALIAALVERPRVRVTLVAVVAGLLVVGAGLYFGYFLLFSGD